jgi:hypothetical protein
VNTESPLLTARRLLTGVVGSRAYGLDHPNSDVDLIRVAILPSTRFLGLNPPTGSALTFHGKTSIGDITVHEVGKFLGLCLSGNPAVIETLNLDAYTDETDETYRIRDLRGAVLSAPAIKTSFYGYANAQIQKAMASENPARREKTARHAYRLAHQGARLWRTGQVVVRADRDGCFAFGEAVAAGDHQRARKLVDWLGDEFHKPTILPDTPDRAAVESYLLDVRRRLG